MGVLPGALIYTVSYQFVSRSIEVWFDARVQGALDAGLDLGRGTLEALVADLGAKTRVAADRLGESRGVPAPLALERLREQLAAQDVALVGGRRPDPGHRQRQRQRASRPSGRARPCCARRAASAW